MTVATVTILAQLAVQLVGQLGRLLVFKPLAQEHCTDDRQRFSGPVLTG